ncbi:coiled-coil domain-containing protein 158-like [Brachyistius frenatus]|uniref:coiled-coil domain-containing protein 158-like n=1 Tax=Brachyistius frenatus TaxID=100188 RepID=UPI0037E74322
MCRYSTMKAHHFLQLRNEEGKKAPSPSLPNEPHGLSPQLMSSQESSLREKRKSLSEPQTYGLSMKIGAHVLLCDYLPEDKVTQAAAATAETQGSSLQLRFNSLTLDELSKELDRRTTETQRLQEEVENATRVALERFGCTYGLNSSPGQSCNSHSCIVYDSPEESVVLSMQQQAVTQPLVSGLDSLNQEVAQTDIICSGKEVLQNATDDCLQQLSDLQLGKTNNLPEEETFSPKKTIVNLRAKLHNVQMEKNILSDMRLKDSRKHVDQMEKMLCMLEELQDIKRSGDQKLQETEDEALALNRKVNEDVNHETGVVQDRRLLSEEQRGSEEYNGVLKQERIEDLMTSLGQEMAMLTDNLSSSKDNSVCLSVKLELLQKLAERKASVHQSQIGELESTLSNHRDKVFCLEQQLTEAQTQLFNTQTERDRSLQQSKELQSQFGLLQRSCEQQQCELLAEVKALRGQLEVAREQLCRAGEENTCLQALLEQKLQEGTQSQELLRETNEELQLRQQETQQLLARLEEAQSQCQTLQAEQETLTLRLNDREKMIDVLRLQMESSIQMTVQHSHTIDSLHQENSLLSNQINQQKLEIQQLRAELDQHQSILAAVELERHQLQASVVDHGQRVREEMLEKQQLTARLELQRTQLLTLTKEHQELHRLHSCKEEEHQGVVLKLQSQLRKAHDELDQMRCTLGILEGADGHGLQAALDMQQEITTRREQVDSLQGRIQHLEENMKKLQQEKRYHKLETQRQLQELTFVQEEKRQLANELEALRSKDLQLKDRISELEAILHKMSESFANCQDFIQLQDQEYFRLKLQHALNLKEFQGQNLHTALNVPQPDVDSPSAHTAPPSPQHAANTQIKSKRQQEGPDLRSLVSKLRGAISENRRPHTDYSAAAAGSFHRRRSAPEREHRTTFSTDNAEEVKAGSRLRRKTCSSTYRELHFLRTAELTKKSLSESHVILSAATDTSSLQLLSLGRRSPVHSLLTSDSTN